MEEVTASLLRSWSWRAVIIVPMLLLAILYTWGWLRLRRAGNWRLASRARLAAFLGGLLILFVALASPIDALATWLFTFHMIQHLLLMMLAPPLLMLANPLPFLLWGLPAPARLGAGRLLAGLIGQRRPSRGWIRAATGPGVIWLLNVIILVGWHDANAYDLALRRPLVHDLEHASFFYGALLFWWFVTGAGPRLQRQFSPLARVGYVAAAIPPTMFVGMGIVFAGAPLYAHYTAMPRLWGIDVLQDQAISGLIMWVGGSMMYIVAALLLVGQWLGRESERAPGSSA